jgi:hypothetical protein
MSGPSASAMSLSSCDNRSRMVSSNNHVAHIADVIVLAVLAARRQATPPAPTSRCMAPRTAPDPPSGYHPA